MGLFPKWLKEFSFSDMWKGVKEDVVKIPETVGKTVEGIVKPVLGGARKALTPTLIWVVILAVVALILYTYFRKAVKA